MNHKHNNQLHKALNELKKSINDIIDLISGNERIQNPDLVVHKIERTQYLVEEVIEHIREKISRVREKYASKYGLGYFTTKRVKNYKYVVFRTYAGRKDIYLPKEEVAEIVDLRKKLRKLYKIRKKLRDIRREAQLYFSLYKYINQY